MSIALFWDINDKPMSIFLPFHSVNDGPFVLFQTMHTKYIHHTYTHTFYYPPLAVYKKKCVVSCLHANVNTYNKATNMEKLLVSSPILFTLILFPLMHGVK